MNDLEKDKLKLLLDIVADRPSTRIAHFSDGGKYMTDTLSDLCATKEYSYQINCTSPDFYASVEEEYKALPHIHLLNFSLARPKYFIQGKEYDYLFVTSTIPVEDRSEFLRKCYDIIKTAGNLILFIPKGSREERDEWLRILQDRGYVSTSTIDDMFEHYDIIISKRMHGWGD
jgi:hypothetical protein